MPIQGSVCAASSMDRSTSMDRSASAGRQRAGDAAAFLCSPIPRDPSQVFFVEARGQRQVRSLARLKLCELLLGAMACQSIATHTHTNEKALQAKTSGSDSFLAEPEVEDMTPLRTNRNSTAPGYVEQLEERVRSLERERQQRTWRIEIHGSHLHARERCRLLTSALCCSARDDRERQ